MIVTTALYISNPNGLIKFLVLLEGKARPRFRFSLLYFVGTIYDKQGDNEKCIEYSKKAHNIAVQYNLEVSRARAAMTIAEVSARVGMPSFLFSAIQYDQFIFINIRERPRRVSVWD